MQARDPQQIINSSMDSVKLINTPKRADQNDTEYKDNIRRNVEHLELVIKYEELKGQDISALVKGISDGKKILEK